MRTKLLLAISCAALLATSCGAPQEKQRPPLILMDEPLSNLDAKLRLEMRTEIKRLHQELGLTTIYVTHDQEEALSLADRLVALRLVNPTQLVTEAPRG